MGNEMGNNNTTGLKGMSNEKYYFLFMESSTCQWFFFFFFFLFWLISGGGFGAEEESLTVEDPKGLSKETSGIDVKDENHVAPGLEAKDFPEKANGFASDDPESVGDVSVDNLTPNREGVNC